MNKKSLRKNPCIKWVLIGPDGRTHETDDLKTFLQKQEFPNRKWKSWDPLSMLPWEGVYQLLALKGVAKKDGWKVLSKASKRKH